MQNLYFFFLIKVSILYIIRDRLSKIMFPCLCSKLSWRLVKLKQSWNCRKKPFGTFTFDRCLPVTEETSKYRARGLEREKVTEGRSITFLDEDENAKKIVIYKCDHPPKRHSEGRSRHRRTDREDGWWWTMRRPINHASSLLRSLRAVDYKPNNKICLILNIVLFFARG